MGIDLEPGWLHTHDAEGKLLDQMIDGVSGRPHQVLVERVQNAMEVKASAASLQAQGYAHEANVAYTLADTAIRIASGK